MQPLNRSSAGMTSTRPVKVLQFGEGNFLRAFADWMVDIMNETAGFNGDIRIVQPIPQGMGDLINKQEGLYHVLLNGLRDGQPVNETRLISCVRGVINPYTSYDEFLKEATNPDLQFIISNTTEAGIVFNPEENSFETTPGTFPGKLTALLIHRFQYFSASPPTGLTIIPCELIEKNGEALKETILQYAMLWGQSEEFINWITHDITYCNTLVDRIVPGYPKETIKEIQERIGYDDQLVVKAEPFHLWVIEPHLADDASLEALKIAFPAEKAGLEVKFVEDLTPYRTRKVLILNGAHTAMVPLAYLQGLRTVRESIEDATIGSFIHEVIMKEIAPTLDLPKADLEKFAEDVLERFRNPYIQHELISIALNSISKFKVRVLPSLLNYVERFDHLPAGLVRSLAALILFYRGTWQGKTIPLNDSEAVLETSAAFWEFGDPATAVRLFLQNRDFWDTDLSAIDGLEEMTLMEMQKQLVEQSQVTESKSRLD